MTSALLSWPAALGGAVLSAFGRTGLWCLVHVARAPLASATFAVMSVGTVLATTNALYMQPERHPAPLWFSQSTPAAPKVAPVPATHAEPVAPAPVAPVIEEVALTPVTGRVTPETPAQTAPEPEAVVGNAEVFEIQEKLTALGLFDGKVDGYYGPQTASAIRAFELRNGHKPTGALSSDTVGAILRAPLPDRRTIAVEPLGLDQTPARAPEVAATPSENTSITPRESAGNDPLGDIVRAVAENAAAGRGPSTDPELVKQVQTGLARLGFLQGEIDGIPGAATAKAIRNFEVYYNYEVTGETTPELVDLLKAAGGLE